MYFPDECYCSYNDINICAGNLWCLNRNTDIKMQALKHFINVTELKNINIVVW